MNTSLATKALEPDTDDAVKAPTIVFACSECWYLGTKRCPVCPSCGSINTLQTAPPEMSDLYFKRVRKQPGFSAAIKKFGGSGDDNGDHDGEDNFKPEVGQEPSQHREDEDEDEYEDDEDFDEDEPAEAAEVATVASFKGGGITRMSSSDEGVDHVFSGGIPRNHAFMLAASPGGGKSTLCRQLAAGMAQLGLKVMIAAGEEVGDIANDEFQRLELYRRFPKGAKKVLFSGSSDTDAVIAAAHEHKVDVLFVDSLSILTSDRVQGPPGKEKQVNYAAYHLMQASHASNEYEGQRPLTVIMISHVTKDGSMAGPNTAKHWTDGAFILEHIDPHTLDAVDDQNKPTGYVRLRVLGKYRRGSAMNFAFYRFTPTGLHTWKPGDPIEDNRKSKDKAKPDKTASKKPATKKPSAKKPATKKPARARASTPATSARRPRRRS